MGVVGGKIIFCEGKKASSEHERDSLDYLLLDRVVENLSGDKPTIVPVGGKFNFSLFAQGFFFPDQVDSQKCIVFRDRDFDICPTEDIKLLEIINIRSKVISLSTHRTCVENYLLDANLIHEYWNVKYAEKQENPSSKWGHGESPGIDILTDWIESSAMNLQEYQAIRWALGDLLNMSQARTQLKTTWTGGSGTLPLSFTLDDCRTEARNLINQFRQGVTFVTEEAFESSLLEYHNQFSKSEFWSNKNYLIWFHGKDLQKMMQKQKSHYISLKNFFDWAVTRLDTAFTSIIKHSNST